MIGILYSRILHEARCQGEHCRIMVISRKQGGPQRCDRIVDGFRGNIRDKGLRLRDPKEPRGQSLA
jgi:hypothetical protein